MWVSHYHMTTFLRRQGRNAGCLHDLARNVHCLAAEVVQGRDFAAAGHIAVAQLVNPREVVLVAIPPRKILRCLAFFLSAGDEACVNARVRRVEAESFSIASSTASQYSMKGLGS